MAKLCSIVPTLVPSRSMLWFPPSGADWARVGVLAPHTTTFTDAGLAPNATYTYRVRAIGGSVASGWSNEVTVRTTPA